ncbi:hypothetical protein CLOM_g22104 [Closterium sp. NIES-68]|nr:hypothetical protein CLOM_g22104 [Closterium sp. NIES-68]GJP74448.1 hypothetical protein CLOP_g5027 [Closterium sp. NIES-67]
MKKPASSSKQQPEARCLSPPGHYTAQRPDVSSNPRSQTPDGTKRSDRIFHPSFGSIIFPSMPSGIMPSAIIPILPSSKSVSSHPRDVSTSTNLCTSGFNAPEGGGGGSLGSTGFYMPNGGAHAPATTASAFSWEAPKFATGVSGGGGLAGGGDGGGGGGGGNRSGFPGGNTTSTATSGGGGGGGSGSGGAAFVQSAMGIDTAAFVSLVNTALPSLVAKSFRRRGGKDVGVAGGAGGAVAGGAFGSDGEEPLGGSRSESRISSATSGGFLGKGRAGGNQDGWRDAGGGGRDRGAMAGMAGGVKGVYADGAGLHRTGSGFPISGFPKSATVGGESDARGAAVADSSAHPAQAALKRAQGGGNGREGLPTSASTSGLVGGVMSAALSAGGAGGLRGGGGEAGMGTGVAREAGLGEDLPEVAMGVLSKWVHLGRGWAPRLFILDKGVLSYCKIEGPHRASVLLEVQRRPGACLVGDEVKRLLRKEQEKQRERDKGGDKDRLKDRDKDKEREREREREKEWEKERASAAVGGQQPVPERSSPTAAQTASAAAIGVATAAAAAAATAATAAAAAASSAAATAAAAAASVLSVPSAISSATVSAFSPAVSTPSATQTAHNPSAHSAAPSAAAAAAAVPAGAASVGPAPTTAGAGAAAAWAGGVGGAGAAAGAAAGATAAGAAAGAAAAAGGGGGGGAGGGEAVSSHADTRPLCRVYGEIHLSVSSLRESQSDEKKFYVFSGTKTLDLRAESCDDRGLWLDLLQAAKDRMGRSLREAEEATFSADVTLEPLRACLARAEVSSDVIKECEEVVRREVLHRLQLRLRVEQERRQMLHERIGQLEADKVELESAVVEESMQQQQSRGDGEEESEAGTGLSGADTTRGALLLLPLADGDGEEGEEEEGEDHSSTQEGEDEFFEAMDDFVGSRRWEELASISSGPFERSVSTLDMEEVGFTYPGVKRRERLPDPAEVEKAAGLWNIIKDCVGKDLSKVCLPVYFNEPISTLQKCCEEMEYSWLLDRAAEYGRRGEHLMRALHVAAFAMSAYACSVEHRVQKPFNPLIGETYEADFPDKGFRFISEKVVHHPPIVAAHCEGQGWRFWGDCNIRIRFWGPSMQLEPLGVLSVAFDDGEVFEWNKVTTGIYNLIIGKLYIDHYGTMRINGNRGTSVRLKLKERSFFDRDTHQVRGYAVGEKGEKLATLVGRWDESLHFVLGDLSHKSLKDEQHLMAHAHLLWRKSPPSPFPCKYTFTPYCITLNEITPDLEGVLPPTDSRLRPDQRALEQGYFERANAEKIRLETRQRQARESKEEGWHPRWFKQMGPHNTWTYVGGYWEHRAKHDWTCVKDIFAASDSQTHALPATTAPAKVHAAQ